MIEVAMQMNPRSVNQTRNIPYPVLTGIDELWELDGDDDEGVTLFANAGKSRSKLLIADPMGWWRLSPDPTKEHKYIISKHNVTEHNEEKHIIALHRTTENYIGLHSIA